ncbi:MAG: superoxide dismutase [Carbonactinosporaceae bacterium]
MFRRLGILGAAAAAGLVAPVVGVATAAPAPPAGTVGTARAAEPAPAFPATVPLPDGFRPEGIAIGPGPAAFFGSLADGSIYRADLVTGDGRIISEGPGTPSVGMKADGRGRLFVAGGGQGDARVVDTGTGDVLSSYQLASGSTFVNDVVLTDDAAWFTDSLHPVLYKLPLGRAGGLPAEDDVVRVPITGELVFGPGFNVNGIARTPDRAQLVVVQSNTGRLFRVDPVNGESRAIDLGGETLANGDGLLPRGRTLYAVQNQLNQVAVVELNGEGTVGEVRERVTHARFDVPTTVASFGNRLYLPNARFNTPPEPTTPYSAIAIPRP